MSTAPKHGAPAHIIKMVREHLDQASLLLQGPILATPTGDVRNQLTEANVHILLADNALRKVPA